MSSQEIEFAEGGFAPATAERLAQLSVGCFVRVGEGGGAYWIELQHIDGDRLCGVLHPELSAGADAPGEPGAMVSFRRGQITALGCDRYCWC
jgi:hypothetical protein